MSEDTQPPAATTESSPAEPVNAVATAPLRRPVLPVLATAISLVALGAVLTQPLWSSRLYKAAPPAEAPASAEAMQRLEMQVSEIAALKAQIGELGRRLEQAEGAAAAGQPVSAPVVDLSPLEQRLAALEARPSAGPDMQSLQQAIASLREEMGRDERKDEAQRTLMIATLQLVTAWQNGQPFDAPWLSALAAAGAADPALAAELDDAAPLLLPWRDKGVPQLARLVADYPALARQAVAATRPEGGTWWQQSVARVTGLVVIRRQGEAVPAEDMSVDAVLARAELKLGENDLSGAVTELEKLDEAASLPLADWMDAARARLQADALAVRLTQRAAGGLLAGNAAVLPSGDGAAASDMPPDAAQTDAPAGEMP